MTQPIDETFRFEDGALFRDVTPQRGTPFEHTCPVDAYCDLAWAAIELATVGFTLETLADQVRNRPRDKYDNHEPWASCTNAAVAIAFWKDRGLLSIRRRRNHVDGGYCFEDAMIEFHALAENG
ncbi:MAG: hypothetical protein ACE5EX_10200 [Phycisphaerae bacterium]